MPAGWDFVAAHDLARKRMAKAAGISVAELERQIKGETDGVGRARRRFELAAPAMANLMSALILGTDPKELDEVRGGARLMLEGCRASLAVVGLRAGESQELDVSDRLSTLARSWPELFGGAPKGEVIDVTPEAETRRLEA